MSDERFQVVLRSLVQAAAELSADAPPTPAGMELESAIERMMEALDAYRAERGLHGRG
jgi:hypothetical protein